MCVPIGNSVPQSLKMSFVWEKCGYWEKLRIFPNFKFFDIDRFVELKETSCTNFVKKY